MRMESVWHGGTHLHSAHSNWSKRIWSPGPVWATQWDHHNTNKRKEKEKFLSVLVLPSHSYKGASPHLKLHLIYLFYVFIHEYGCMWAYMWALWHVCMEVSKQYLGISVFLFLFLTMWVPGIKLRSSGSAVSFFTHWTILSTQDCLI